MHIAQFLAIVILMIMVIFYKLISLGGILNTMETLARHGYLTIREVSEHWLLFDTLWNKKHVEYVVSRVTMHSTKWSFCKLHVLDYRWLWKSSVLTLLIKSMLKKNLWPVFWQYMGNENTKVYLMFWQSLSLMMHAVLDTNISIESLLKLSFKQIRTEFLKKDFKWIHVAR